MSKEFLDIQANIECGFTLERVRDMIRTYSQGFFSMLLGTLGARLLGNILADWGINRAGEGAIAKRQVRGIVRAGNGNKNKKIDF